MYISLNVVISILSTLCRTRGHATFPAMEDRRFVYSLLKRGCSGSVPRGMQTDPARPVDHPVSSPPATCGFFMKLAPLGGVRGPERFASHYGYFGGAGSALLRIRH